MIDNIFLLINLDGPSSWNLAGRIPASVANFGCLVRVFLSYVKYRVPNLCLFIPFLIESFIIIINYFNFNNTLQKGL